jgi:hypothetical protein
VILSQPEYDERVKICLGGEQCDAIRAVLLVFKFLKNARCEKRAKNAENEIFEFKMSSIWIKK